MDDNKLVLAIAHLYAIGLEKREVAKNLNVNLDTVQGSLSKASQKSNLKNGCGFILFFLKKIISSIRFVSRMQAGCCIALAIFSVLCFIGMFFNPSHIFTFVMSVVLMVAIYLEKNW